MNKDEILNRGFTEYSKSPFDSPSCDALYQKLYRGKDGEKRYFLNIKHYSMTHPTTKEDLSGYEIDTQLYLKGSHNAVNIKFLDDNLDEAEKFIETLFSNNIVENYE